MNKESIADQPMCEICHSKQVRVLYKFDSNRIIEYKDCTIARCRNCGFVFIYPKPSSQEIERLYSSVEYHNLTYFDNCKVDYTDKGQILLYKRILGKIESVAKKGRLLDVGCGTGAFLDIARRRGWESIGVDISERACNYARENFGAEVFSGEIYQANFPDRYFDVVTLWDVLEHVPCVSKFLAETNRILKDNGLLFVETINVDTLVNRLGGLIYRASLGRIEYPIRMLYGPHHLYYFTPYTLGVLLRGLEFNVLEMHQEEYHVKRIGVSWPIQAILSTIYFFQKIVNMGTVVLALARKGSV